jgi:TatA/E family protein of Tat protein translocase
MCEDEFMGIGIKELMVILAIVVVLFGTKRLKNIGTDLALAVKGFRKAMDDDNGAASSISLQGTDTNAVANTEAGEKIGEKA